MPEISRFLGIIIRIYYDEHPPPHFHVQYGEHNAVFRIDTLELVKGYVPRRVQALTLEWAFQHRAELRHDWQLAEQGEPMLPIAPLED